MRIPVFLALAALLLVGCRDEKAALEEYSTREVTLPDGSAIRAEVMTRPEDMMRGMMFRESLEPDRGMLFFHGSPGKYPYWMYQVKIPLDIIFADSRGRVVEVVENVEPCTTKASECPKYGGTAEAMVVLELNAGAARKHGIRVGEIIRF